MQRFIVLAITILLLGSCAEQVEKYKYYRFCKQITPSGKYIIYDYARYGSMAFSSDISGTELFKIDDKFAEGEGEEIDGAISEWLSNDTLLVFNFKSNLEQPKDTFPIKIEYSNLGDFVVKTIYYKTNAGYRSISYFDSVETTNDSIFIHLVTTDNKENQILSFPLGSTTIKTKSDSITHIEISTRLNKNMNFVYKNKDGTFTNGLPEIGTTWYDLTPTKKISRKGLDKRKIFWEE
jgi:hypothetical protein